MDGHIDGLMDGWIDGFKDQWMDVESITVQLSPQGFSLLLMLAVGPLPRTLTEALAGVGFWALSSILLTYMSLNVLQLILVFKVSTSKI